MAGIGVVVEGLNKSFVARGRQVDALRDVHLRINSGEFVSILGPSGCGKSTLLRIIAGLDRESSGRVIVDGVPVVGPSPDHGVVFQRPALFPWLDVIDNVTFGPRMQKKGSASDINDRARDLLAAVGLAGFERHKVYELSGGMMHRVALARVLINKPNLLLMDEPFAALDAQTRLTMQELLVNIWRGGDSSVLFITHDVDEALLLSDRVVVMTARPGTCKSEYHVPLARPRDLSMLATAEFVALKSQLLNAIRSEIDPLQPIVRNGS